MHTKPPKKLLIMNILDILETHTDENHTLTQKEIVEILESKYDMAVDRKAVKRNLLNLIDLGYNIDYTEAVRINKKGEEESLYTDWYMERAFSDSELRLLIDSLLFSKHIPHSQCKELIEKLSGLSNKYFKSRVNYISMISSDMPENKQLFYTIDVLDEAMTGGKQVSFYYNEYGSDKVMHPRKNNEGKIREYIINPYQIAATNGRYYLICNLDKYNDVSNYRVDRITNIAMLDTPVKPMGQVKGLENGLNLPKHMAEHLYMFTGESAPVTFRAKKYLITDLLDWFGKDIHFSDENEDEITARVMVNMDAMRKWALQYALHIKILTPKKLVEAVREDVMRAAEIYYK